MTRPLPVRKALLVYPRFSPDSFWNYHETCDIVGARYSAAPLGLITLAALLPAEWDLRLIDCNVEELHEADLAWADLVMTGGMLPQQLDTLEIIRMAHRSGKRVVVGGPDATSSPALYREADFLVLGEAEEIIADLLSALADGAERGIFRSERFPDLALSPVPRFDLLKISRYMHVGVQRSRGCPFSCEFCNVIELNGRRPRSKSTGQMLRELEALYHLGYRGHVDFVDDNLIGDVRSVKPFLAELETWLRARRDPFEFTTEASINLAGDEELLGLMQRANFFAVFVGVETPDPVALRQTGKRQNLGRDIGESIRRIYRAGMFVNAGFIIGFDSERESVAAAMTACIEDTSIPVCMVGMLYALPTTRLARRLETEGRLWGNTGQLLEATEVDQCSTGPNFETLRPRHEILEDYRSVLERTYEPRAFFERVRRVAREIDVSQNRYRSSPRRTLRDLRTFGRVLLRVGRHRDTRGPLWRALGDCLRHNPRAVRVVVSFAALYLHYGPFARRMEPQLASQIAALVAQDTRPVAAIEGAYAGVSLVSPI